MQGAQNFDTRASVKALAQSGRMLFLAITLTVIAITGVASLFINILSAIDTLKGSGTLANKLLIVFAAVIALFYVVMTALLCVGAWKTRFSGDGSWLKKMSVVKKIKYIYTQVIMVIVCVLLAIVFVVSIVKGSDFGSILSYIITIGITITIMIFLCNYEKRCYLTLADASNVLETGSEICENTSSLRGSSLALIIIMCIALSILGIFVLLCVLIPDIDLSLNDIMSTVGVFSIINVLSSTVAYVAVFVLACGYMKISNSQNERSLSDWIANNKK